MPLRTGHKTIRDLDAIDFIVTPVEESDRVIIDDNILLDWDEDDIDPGDCDDDSGRGLFQP